MIKQLLNEIRERAGLDEGWAQEGKRGDVGHQARGLSSLASKFAYLAKNLPGELDRVAAISKEGGKKEHLRRGMEPTNEAKLSELMRRTASLIVVGHGMAYDGLVALRSLAVGKTDFVEKMLKKHGK